MGRTIGLSLLFGAALLLAGWAGYSIFARSGPAPEMDNEVTYICLETHEVVDGPMQDVPAVNPKTGKRTLVRAVYSNRENGWVPIPSDDVLRKNRKMLSQGDGNAPLSFTPKEEPVSE